MSGSALLALPVSGEMTVWRLVEAGHKQPTPSRRRDWSLRIGVFCLGLLATASGATAVWDCTGPDTILRTRILADGAADAAGRAALSDIALRLAGAADRAPALEDGGESLVVTARAPDPAQAEQQSRSMVDAILNAPVATAPAAAVPAATTPGAALRAERARLAASADAMQMRSMAISAALTALTRDTALANRSAADHKPGRETLDKGNAALADLQLQRLQLVAKYQDTYPAVLALDSQISNLRVFLMDEAHRVDARPAPSDAADAMLTSEHDRLVAEMSQLEDRRRAVTADLAGIDRKLAAVSLAAPTVAYVAAESPPVLIAAATTSFAAGDARLTTVPAIAAAGLALSALAALLVRRRRRTGLPHGMLLEPVPAGMLTGNPQRTLPQAAHVSLASGPTRSSAPFAISKSW